MTVTLYERRHQQAVMDLLFRSHYVHYHLDWHDTDEWLNNKDAPTFVLWDEDRIIGVLGVSIPLEGTCWLRLAAIIDGVDIQHAIETLWQTLYIHLQKQHIKSVWILGVHAWLTPHLQYLDFRYVEDVVTLRRNTSELPSTPQSDIAIDIRTLHMEDVPMVADVDRQAFHPPWQMTDDDIYHALRHAAIATVAQIDNKIVGYQISTKSHSIAHLARLAVHPTLQGRKIGAALLDDMIRRFQRRGISTMTVNTQASNTHSQRLYNRYYFERNGYDFPVWRFTFT